MANAYRTRGDVTLSRVVGVEEGEGDKKNVITESVLYPAGSVVRADELTERDKDRASNGDLDHLLESVSDEEAQEALASGADSDFAVFVPEHEAEAHALEVYGHTVVPPEQALELGAASAQYAADYQGAVREHGLDRRPVQEAFAQPRERVPDEVLTGGQHRTGAPFERGPEGYEGVDPEGDQAERAEAQRIGGQRAEAEVAAQSSPRQRPGSTQAQAPHISDQAEGGGSERREGESTSQQSSPAQEQNPAHPVNPAPATDQGN